MQKIKISCIVNKCDLKAHSSPQMSTQKTSHVSCHTKCKPQQNLTFLLTLCATLCKHPALTCMHFSKKI